MNFKIIGLVVAIVVFSSVLLPIIDNVPEAPQGENTLYVMVLGGQSNMAYIPEYMDLQVVNEEIPAPNYNCYYIGTATRPIWDHGTYSNYGMHSLYTDGAWKLGGEEAALAYNLSEKTKSDVLIINVAIPGYSINQFVPPATGGQHIINALDAALDSIPDSYSVVKCGWAWCQGESDKTTPYTEYISDFKTIKGIFADYGFDTCYLVETKPSDSKNSHIAQQMILESVPNVILASTAPESFTVANGGLIPGNTLHYSQHGRDIVGEDIAEAVNIPRDNSAAGYQIIHLIPFFLIAGIVCAAAYMIVRSRT